jgi:hypothetical protein
MMGGGFMHGRFDKDGKATGDDLVNSKAPFFFIILLKVLHSGMLQPYSKILV